MTMWYVHPTNKITNEEISRRLTDNGEGSAQSFRQEVLAEDGKRYDVIQLPYRLLREMYDETTARSGGDFAFIPFKAERTDETLKFVPEFLLRKSKSRKVKDAVRFVDAQQRDKVPF